MKTLGNSTGSVPSMDVANWEAFFFLVGLEFEFRASHLQSRLSTASATPLVHFGDWGGGSH
jgi:hypothetical protein